MPDPVNGPTVSEVSIANQALTWLGQKPITSFNDRSTTAEWMRNNYPFVRNAVVESRMWTFATVKIISITADLDAWGLDYVHPLPTGWMSVFKVYSSVNSNGSRTIDTTFRMEGGNVVSQCSTLYLWGIEYVTDTGKFTPSFAQALAARLAADACMPFTENASLQRDMWGLYNDKLAEAATRDGQQGANEVIQSNTLINARYGGVPG
jgi:hypothetical protein